MSRREIEIAERIDELKVDMQYAQTDLEHCDSDLLGYEADYEESGDKDLLRYIQLARFDIENLEADILGFQLEIEELEQEDLETY